MVSTGSSEECVLSNRSSTAQQSLSLIYGPTSPPLVSKTIGALLEDQARQYGERTAVSVPWQSSRLTYKELADHSAVIAKAMLGMGLRHGECLGIMAGNCYQYTEVFLGGARIGCPVVVLNNTYSAVELKFAVSRSGELNAVFIPVNDTNYICSLQVGFHSQQHWYKKIFVPHRNTA
jgi:acyl-CoA synthetase (AMP-forming)/AMP-acid ligase II